MHREWQPVSGVSASTTRSGDTIVSTNDVLSVVAALWKRPVGESVPACFIRGLRFGARQMVASQTCVLFALGSEYTKHHVQLDG